MYVTDGDGVGRYVTDGHGRPLQAEVDKFGPLKEDTILTSIIAGVPIESFSKYTSIKHVVPPIYTLSRHTLTDESRLSTHTQMSHVVSGHVRHLDSGHASMRNTPQSSHAVASYRCEQCQIRQSRSNKAAQVVAKPAPSQYLHHHTLPSSQQANDGWGMYGSRECLVMCVTRLVCVCVQCGVARQTFPRKRWS